MRLLTLVKLQFYLRDLQRGPRYDNHRQRVEYLHSQGFTRAEIVKHLGGAERAEPILRHVRRATRTSRIYLEAFITFTDCLAYTFSLPPDRDAEMARLEAIVRRRRSTPFAAVSLAPRRRA